MFFVSRNYTLFLSNALLISDLVLVITRYHDPSLTSQVGVAQTVRGPMLHTVARVQVPVNQTGFAATRGEFCSESSQGHICIIGGLHIFTAKLWEGNVFSHVCLPLTGEDSLCTGPQPWPFPHLQGSGPHLVIALACSLLKALPLPLYRTSHTCSPSRTRSSLFTMKHDMLESRRLAFA